jgi:hypothetical protein
MTGPPSSRASFPPLLSPRCTAALPGSVSALRDPLRSIQSLWEKARHVPSPHGQSCPGGAHTCALLAETLPVQSPVAPAAARITEKGYGGRRSGTEITARDQPDARTLGHLSGPSGLGLGLGPSQLREPNSAGEIRPREGQGEPGSRTRGGPSGTSAGGGTAGCRQAPPPAAPARPLPARLRPCRPGNGILSLSPSPRPYSQSGFRWRAMGSSFFPRLGLLSF